MNIVNTLQKEKWNHFVMDHPAGNIFNTPEMFQVFRRAKNHRPKLWAVVDEEKNILVLMIPVHVSLGIFIPRCFRTWSIVYGGVLGTSGMAGLDALELLLRTYKNKIGIRSIFTEIRNVFPLGEKEDKDKIIPTYY